jgi:PAS domain-containing protein
MAKENVFLKLLDSLWTDSTTDAACNCSPTEELLRFEGSFTVGEGSREGDVYVAQTSIGLCGYSASNRPSAPDLSTSPEAHQIIEIDARLTDPLEHLPVPVGRMDSFSKVLYVNPASIRRFGVDKLVDNLFMAVPDGIAKYEGGIHFLVDHEDAVIKIVKRIVDRGGYLAERAEMRKRLALPSLEEAVRQRDIGLWRLNMHGEYPAEAAARREEASIMSAQARHFHGFQREIARGYFALLEDFRGVRDYAAFKRQFLAGWDAGVPPKKKDPAIVAAERAKSPRKSRRLGLGGAIDQAKKKRDEFSEMVARACFDVVNRFRDCQDESEFVRLLVSHYELNTSPIEAYRPL